MGTQAVRFDWKHYSMSIAELAPPTRPQKKKRKVKPPSLRFRMVKHPENKVVRMHMHNLVFGRF
jgi:hypothetical protein